MGTAKRERQKANRALRRVEEYKQDKRDRVKRRAVRIGIVVVLIVGAVVAIAMFAGDDGGDTEETGGPANTATGATSGSGGTTAGTATEGTAGEASTGPVFHDFTYGEGQCAPDEKPSGDARKRPTSQAPFPFDDAPQQCIDPGASYTATFETSEGTIEVDLDTENVPGTVNNFVNLAKWGYYDDTTIFRGAQSIGIIQGGGMTNTDRPGYMIPDEGEQFTYEPGQLVMARTAEPDSAGGQWFFNVNDNASALDGQGTYVVFGTITEGLDVAEQILSLFPEGEETNPEQEITVDSVTITEG